MTGDFDFACDDRWCDAPPTGPILVARSPVFRAQMARLLGSGAKCGIMSGSGASNGGYAREVGITSGRWCGYRLGD